MVLGTLMLMSVCLAGCETTNKGAACAGWKPIIVTQIDMLTMDEGTKRQIVAHNEFGEKVCGWKAAQ